MRIISSMSEYMLKLKNVQKFACIPKDRERETKRTDNLGRESCIPTFYHRITHIMSAIHGTASNQYDISYKFVSNASDMV